MRPQRDPLPGPGERRQLGGVLLPGDHGGGRGAPQPAIRAIFIRCALGSAGYRRRYRGVSSRRGHPVRLQHVWEGSRGSGRERHYVPPALSDPRRRTRPRIPGRHGDSLVPGQGRGATPRWRCGSGRSRVFPGTWASTRAAWCSPISPCRASARLGGPQCRAVRSSSGIRRTAQMPAS